MKESNPVAIARKDYKPPNWQIEQTELSVELDASLTVVTSVLHLRQCGDGPLRLDGTELTLSSIKLDGELLNPQYYTVTDNALLVESLPKQCQLEVITHIVPEANTALEGLYCSGNHLTTQCEAEGFRKITFYLDRPDVLSTFKVKLVADKEKYPVLLSNGNLVSTEELEDGRHSALWSDPFPKPCYLFALVAGKLARIEDRFVTRSNRSVDLHIYVEEHNLDQCQFAMDALKRSMQWDETVYGLEYDLDLFMIVAVDSFNAGAMENKGLNIFNSKYVLASPELATDSDILGVESVIAHEYFHNWTGNRVTCRDWFQLSLKEGLTVFRDQQFSADMQSSDVKRIQDVRLLREHQFAEDAGPMSHPIRPDEYIEINNFYTLTVYEKGAEVIRMIHTLLGEKNYHNGIDLYFERHDGQAVTCDDFVQAMQDASGIDLHGFKQWYSQSGTPTLKITDSYDANIQQYTLQVNQDNPDSNGQPRTALHIPLRIGLLDASGGSLPIPVGKPDAFGSCVLDVTQAAQSFVFEQVPSKPVPSLLRGFSAPVIMEYSYDDDALALLLANDTDSFNRWEAGQRLATRIVHQQLDVIHSHQRALGNSAQQSNESCTAIYPELSVSDTFVNAFEPLLNDAAIDAGYKALILDMPGIKSIANGLQQINVQSIDAALQSLNNALATRYQSLLIEWVTNTPNRNQTSNIGPRMLANAALSLLSYLPDDQWLELAVAQYDNASNMTDRVAALGLICNVDDEAKARCLADFYKRYAHHKLVVDKWFSLQATAQHEHVIRDANKLMGHDAFNIENPNRVRSLIGAFANANPLYFHAADGSGYALVSNTISRLDSMNPQVAARLVTPFLQWRRYTEPNQRLMREELIRISKQKPLSAAVFELVNKALEG